MSAQPTPEGPYHPAMDRLSVKFGPDEFQVKFSSPETVGTECILMNMGFAQGQASSAKEVEVYRKALETISHHEDCLCKPGMEVVKEALLTSKPEPVAKKCPTCGKKYAGDDSDATESMLIANGQRCNCKPVATVRK